MRLSVKALAILLVAIFSVMLAFMGCGFPEPPAKGGQAIRTVTAPGQGVAILRG